MNKKLRSKIMEFINSEEGKVGVKTSLTFGLVGVGLLLMQTIFPSVAKAQFECFSNDDCAGDEVCHFWCKKISGVCQGDWHSQCVDA